MLENEAGENETINSLFPRSAAYDPDWVREQSLGENVLYNLESLTEVLDLRPGQRVLDLACGRAVSSIFLAREFGVQVWAVDSAISPSENFGRIVEWKCENKVFPLRLDARELPFAEEFFDAVICIDSYMYFGTDDKYLAYISRFLKPRGVIGIVDVGFAREIDSYKNIPRFLRKDYSDYWYFVHSLDWWKNFWEKTGLVEVERAEVLPHNDVLRRVYISDYDPSSGRDAFAEGFRNDAEGFLHFFRLLGRRTDKEAFLEDYSEDDS